MEYKKDFLAYPDRGIYGTIAKIDTVGTEDGYANVYYYPLQSHPLKRGKLCVIRNIPNDCIHHPHNPWKEDGVQKDITFIYTGESGSIVEDIFKSNLQRKIDEYKDTIDSLKKQVAASKQEADEARSGVNTTIRSMKAMGKGTREPGEGLIPPQRPSYYNEFNDFQDLEEGY